MLKRATTWLSLPAARRRPYGWNCRQLMALPPLFAAPRKLLPTGLIPPSCSPEAPHTFTIWVREPVARSGALGCAASTDSPLVGDVLACTVLRGCDVARRSQNLSMPLAHAATRRDDPARVSGRRARPAREVPPPKEASDAVTALTAIAGCWYGARRSKTLAPPREQPAASRGSSGLPATACTYRRVPEVPRGSTVSWSTQISRLRSHTLMQRGRTPPEAKSRWPPAAPWWNTAGLLLPPEWSSTPGRGTACQAAASSCCPWAVKPRQRRTVPSAAQAPRTPEPWSSLRRNV
mmetsp:Transcript_26849/g.63730  ORF Transcript_26849/g.63730 Transcript_26849/m.63730 type:complete len:292 (+) Transcript_26849:90-965(+)